MLDLNQLYNMDCMDGMKQFPDKYFDLAIVDPPYGIGENGNRNASRTKLARSRDYSPYTGYDKEPPSIEYFDELFRVSKNQIIWGANHFISRIPYDSPCWIVWDKHNGKSDFADCELAWSSFKSSVRKVDFMWHGMLQGKSTAAGHLAQGNKELNEIRIHPNQKPVAIYNWLLNKYAKSGNKILDTHVGSASSLVACHQLGFELDETYFKSGSERLQAEKAQIKMEGF